VEPYDLRSLPEEGASIDAPLEAAWIEAALNEGIAATEMAVVPTGPGSLKLRLERAGGERLDRPIVRLTGALAVDLSTSCVRCLADLPVALRPRLELTCFPATEDPEEDAADEARVSYEGHMLDLPEVVREALLLELEVYPSCADEAACGDRTRQLIEDAGVAPGGPEPDPRWAGLDRFRLKSE